MCGCELSCRYFLNNQTVGVVNYQVNSETDTENVIEGYERLKNNREGKLLVSFPSAGRFDGMYLILGTDYNTTHTLWFGHVNRTTLRQRSRTHGYLPENELPSVKALAAAQAVIEANMLAPEFILTDQTNCWIN